MNNKTGIKKYVEIYEGMPLLELSKSLLISEAEIIQNIGNNPSLEDLICIVQLYDGVPICLKSLSLLKITIESVNQVDIYTPCISIMGHINHGKSSIVGSLVSKDICSKEAGNITQNISLYNFTSNKQSFILIDTPGHSALDNMRNIIIPLSEIIIIVVAANAGPEAQTFKIIENTNHKDRILCLNKIDAPNLVNEEYIYQKCANYGLVCNFFNENNELPVVKVSAKNNDNLQELIDQIIHMINTKKYRTDLCRPASGYILDAFIVVGKGRLIRVLLKSGSCTIGDNFCLGGEIYTINRMFINGVTLCKKNEYVKAGCFVDIVCDAKCSMGDLFFIINNKKMQNEICALQIKDNMENHNKDINKQFVVYISTLQQHNLLANILPKHSIVKIIMHDNITKEDIIFAKEQNLEMIIWYKINNNIVDLLTQYNIKYISSPNLLIGDIETFMKEDIIEEAKDKICGQAVIKAIFFMKKDVVLGNDVKSGKIVLGNKCIIIRNDKEIGRGIIRSLEHNRETITEAKMGLECGLIIKDITYTNNIKFDNFIIGDTISCIE